MRLIAAARAFDKEVIADAYNPGTTFKAQFDLFDDSRRDGMTIERRIISVSPTVSMPARRTVSYDGLTWLIGDSQRDYYRGAAIRHKYVAHQATELVTPRTFSQALAGAGGTPAWAARVWVKGSKEIDISSDITDVFDIYFSPSETVSENMLVTMGGRTHLVRSTYPSSAGLLVALADELPDPVVTTAVLTNRTYLPTSDTYSVDPVTVACIRLRWQSHFRYPVRGTERFKPGDVAMIVLKSAATPKAGDPVVVSGETYTVQRVLDEVDCWSLHLSHDRD